VVAVALAVAAVAAKPDPKRFFRVDARRHVVSVSLIAGYDATNNGFNFDGYGRGKLLVTVPLGWRVRVTCENRAAVRHSCAVVDGPMTIRPAFRHAAIPRPLEGLRHGEVATFSFMATRRGTFRLACLVPGHEEARMWDVLDVARGGRPSIVARPGPRMS
jgi:Sulfocyanin (SoxE) domain